MNGRIEFDLDPIRVADVLDKGLRNKAIRIAMNAAGGVVKKAVVAQAPQRFGYLKKAQRVKVRPYKNKAIWVAVVGAKSDFVKERGVYKRGKKKGQPVRYRPSKIVHILQRGSYRTKRNPYLSRALSVSLVPYQQKLITKITEQVAELLPKNKG